MEHNQTFEYFFILKDIQNFYNFENKNIINWKECEQENQLVLK